MGSRGTVTNRLSDVVQLLQMAHKTGLLTVNRDGVDNTLEEGSIELHNGQVIAASLGQLRGAVALERLMTWACYFVFHPANPKDVHSPSPPAKNGASTGYEHTREPPRVFSNGPV